MNHISTGDLYMHFKGHLVEVICVGKHSENETEMVVYRRISDGSIWIRPKDMFLSEVDHDKYPRILQKYRFRKLDGSDVEESVYHHSYIPRKDIYYGKT